ncbi:tyrosine--tRNA ligase [Candidatus Falkowbacteria bacterium]|nr:tyrosine--tRNA ligase [Candidatus Falkowbacteria bacterium]
MSKIITDEKQIEKVLTRGVENVYPNKDSLKKVLMSGKKLRIYNGIDPTGQLHLGHGVVLRKLRQFQDLGHEVIVLIGDFTATIGDPTDKLSARQPLTREQVLNNAKDYKKLIGKILDTTKSNVRFLHNEKWTNKLKPADMLALASYFTISRLLERDMFQERIKAGKEIHVHEFLYPIFQAYDSVTMDVDLEVGGNDQTFNMLAGRTLMKKMKNKEKFVLTMKLLEDPTGKKMGKSEGNAITLADSPADMYGKIMSWPDEMIMPSFEILTDISEDTLLEVKDQLALGLVNPRDIKMKLAYEAVKIYLGGKAAEGAEENFKRVFQEHQKPIEMPEVKIDKEKLIDGKIGVLDLFVLAGLANSNNEMRRLIKEGAIKINDELIFDINLQVEIKDGMILQRGKKQFVKIK